MLFRYLLPFDISVVYIPVTILTGFAFLGKFSIPKPKLRGILIMVAIGLVEAAALLLIWYFRTR
jgi:CDP-diacylglycerol--serine O-phosphatidyltransferase